MRGSKHFFVKYMAPLAVVLALCGCSRLAVHQPEEVRTGSLEIVVENFLGEGPRKTIAPTQLTVQQLAGVGYTLKLTGTTGRMTLPEQTVTLTNGRATLPDIPVGLWELTLAAYSGATKVLQGKATHQVRQVGNGSVSFVLSPVGLAGTGSVGLILNWSLDDKNLIFSRTDNLRLFTMGLYNPVTGQAAASNLVGEWRYNAGNTQQLAHQNLAWNRDNVPPGEYLVKFTMSGGGLPNGTTLVWSDNLYVEPGRVATATITVPQLAHKPAVPAGVLEYVVPEANTLYEGELTWQRVYNADSYEVQLKSYTGGNWTNFNETNWNALSGGTQYHFTAANMYPVNNPPHYMDGGLHKDDTSIRFKISREGRYWVARMRAVNAYGGSNWVYINNLFMPRPEITSASPTNIGNSASGVWDKNKRFDMNFTFTPTSYGTAYEFHWMRLDTGTLQEAMTDEGWDRLRAINTQGSGQNTLTNISSNTHRLDGFLLGKKWVFRMRTVSNNGSSPWFYYNRIVQQD